MKKNLLTGVIAAIGLAIGATSCSSDQSSPMGNGMGRISPRLAVDGDIVTATPCRANEDVVVTVSDLKLRLSSHDGSFTQEWESIDDFDENQDFKVGDYTLEAYYGSCDESEGYAKPHFHGTQDISVKYDHTTAVDVCATMANSRLKIRYTDAFKDYMTSYSAQIHTSKGRYVTVPADEVSPVYVIPGLVNVNLTFTKPGGNPVTIEAARITAKAKTEHVVTVDFNNGDSGADARLLVTFDDTIDSEDIEIDLSDDLLDAPAPEVTTEGWTAGQTFQMIEGTLPDTPVKANILARGKIASVTLSTTSTMLRAQGWPAEADLVTLNDATYAAMESLGFKARGIRKNPDMMGVIDFTEVFRNLGVTTGSTQSTHQFTLQVKDKYGKLSETMDFTVVSSLGHINIISATAEVGRRTINTVFESNASSLDGNVVFQMRNLLGAWDDLTLAEVVSATGTNPTTYTVKLTAPAAIISSHTVRGTFGSSYSDCDIEVTTPEFELISTPADAFATHAYVTVKCDDADDALVARAISEITVDGMVCEDFKITGADIHIPDLTPATEHTIVASTNNHTASVNVTTEVKRGDRAASFSTWNSNKLGDYQYLWSTTPWIGMDNTEIGPWGTLNEITTSTYGSGHGSAAITGGCSYKATSGTIPANGRSTQSFAPSNWAGTTNHADGHTTGNARLHTDQQHTGTNAALIRTVGWGSGNSAHAGTAGNLHEDAGFNTCQNRTAGKLYLGTYNAELGEKSDEPGIAFPSRPSTLQFYYRYNVTTPGNGDFATAKIIVYAEDGSIIAEASKNLVERSSYGEKPETIDLTYPRGAKKAARLSISFCSSGNPAATSDNNKNFWHTPGSNCTSGGEYVGSELYIDDVRLLY